MSDASRSLNIEFLWLANEQRGCPVEADGYLPMDEGEIKEQIFPLLMIGDDDDVPYSDNISDVLRESFVLLARDKDLQDIVGIAVLSMLAPSFREKRLGMVREFAVDGGCLGSGVENRMAELLEESGKALGLKELVYQEDFRSCIAVLEALGRQGFMEQSKSRQHVRIIRS
jgi:hypothetical protein